MIPFIYILIGKQLQSLVKSSDHHINLAIQVVIAVPLPYCSVLADGVVRVLYSSCSDLLVEAVRVRDILVAALSIKDILANQTST